MSEKEGRIENNLLTEKLKVVNVGIWTFADDLRSQDVEVVQVEWRPPAGGDIDMLKLLEKLGS
jgi:FdrA protein